METSSKDFWWTYISSHDLGPGSIRVNLGLQKQSPLPDYPYLVVTGTTYTTTRADGLPDVVDLERLNVLSYSIVDAIQKTSPAIYVGTFTYNHEQLHYVYVKDTTQIETVLGSLYLTDCPGCKAYTNIKQDLLWTGYSEFLYPNQTTFEFYRMELKKLGFIPPED